MAEARSPLVRADGKLCSRSLPGPKNVQPKPLWAKACCEAHAARSPCSLGRSYGADRSTCCRRPRSCSGAGADRRPSWRSCSSLAEAGVALPQRWDLLAAPLNGSLVFCAKGINCQPKSNACAGAGALAGWLEYCALRLKLPCSLGRSYAKAENAPWTEVLMPMCAKRRGLDPI